MNCAHYDISFSNSFVTVYTTIVPSLGVIAVASNVVSILSTIRNTKILSLVEYTKCFIILKTVVLLYDIHLCFFFIPFPLFPCQGLFMQGLGYYLGMKTHPSLVLNLTVLSVMCSWYTCCLFQRYQSMLPSYHKYKLRRSEMYLGYFILNLIMVVNPLLLAVTIRSDEALQRIQLRQSPMSWLLFTTSFKIYNDENSPLLAPLHFPLTVITFVLNTAITIFFAKHMERVMKSRTDHVSSATVAMNNQIVKNLQFQSNISTIGMVTPFVFWTASMFFQFVATEVSTLLLLLLPLGSIFNSIHSISTRSVKKDTWPGMHTLLRYKSTRTMWRTSTSQITIQITSPSETKF